jgi:hypothetical protein
MRRTLIAIALVSLLVFPSCISSDAISAAQAYLESYSFESEGQCDGQVAFNAKYLAIDAKTTLTVRFRKGATILWEREFNAEVGRRSYMVTFNSDGEFLEVITVPWAQVRTSMTWLPGDVTP